MTAYLVFHDGFDGAMEVWPSKDLPTAQRIASKLQERLDSMGYENCGVWKAYEKIPRNCNTWKLNGVPHKAEVTQ